MFWFRRRRMKSGAAQSGLRQTKSFSAMRIASMIVLATFRAQSA